MRIAMLKGNKNLNQSTIIFGFIALLFVITPLVGAAGLSEEGVLSLAGVVSNGPSFDLAESGGYLYVAEGSEVRVYDISNPTAIPAMTFQSSLAQLPIGGPVRAVVVDGQYLYIAAENKFVIADISHPAQPVAVATLDNPVSKSAIYDVVVKGNYAYLLINPGGVQVVDVSNRADPQFLNKIVLAGKNKPMRGTIDGNYLYVGLQTDNRMDILDISSPANPQVVGSFKAPVPGYNTTSSVAVRNGYAYLAEYHNGVRVVDVTNPAQPTEVTSLMGINANDIKILGNYAYVSVRYQGFSIIDISNPQHISVVGKAKDAAYYNEGIYPIPGYTFLAMESYGFGVYNTKTVTAPSSLVKIAVMGGADSLIAKDNTLFIGMHNNGVWVVDVSNPAAPKQLAQVPIGGRNQDISLQDNRLYVAGIWTKLNVIDVSSPANPVIACKQFGNQIHSVLADGKYLYTDTSILDISNPAAPVAVAKTPYLAGRYAKYGNDYLVVAAYDGTNNGLHILNIKDKKNPVHLSTFNAGNRFVDVAVTGNVAVALSGYSILTVDISNPSAPTLLNETSYKGKWTGNALDVDKSMVYAVGNGGDQVRAFDISDPAHIKLVDSLQFPEGFDSVDYDNGYIYAGQKSAVHIIKFEQSPDAGAEIMRSPTGQYNDKKASLTVSQDNRVQTPKGAATTRSPAPILPFILLGLWVLVRKHVH
jgi:hypothetical protein